MNNDTKSGFIAVIIGGLLFVVGPIVLILYGLISAPLGMKTFLFIWLILCLLCFSFIKDKPAKLGITLSVTFIYAISFAIWYAEEELDGYLGGGGLGDTIGMFLIPFATLVPLYSIGAWINSKLEQNKKDRMNRQISALTNELAARQQTIKNIEKELNGRRKFFSLFSLLEMSGAELTQIKANDKVNNIAELTDMLKESENKMKDIKSEIKKLSSSISGGQ